MDPEKEMIAEFERMVRRDFPNPERVGCPGPEQLRLLAKLSRGSELSHLLEHVRKCSPCFDELKRVRKGQACTPFERR